MNNGVISNSTKKRMNMSKKIMVLITAVVLMSMGMVNAQKTGHVSSQELLMALPESKDAQALLEKFQKEFQDELQMMESIYKKKIEEYQAKAADPATPKTVLETLQKDIAEYEQRIYSRREQIEQDLQTKESDLFKPILQKIKDAIGKVAKEQGVNYVFDTQVMIFFDGGNDLMPLVKKELGIVTTP